MTKKIRVNYLDNDAKDWVLYNKKTKKKITNVIIGDISLRAYKRWVNGKDHTKGTQFVEDVDLEWTRK